MIRRTLDTRYHELSNEQLMNLFNSIDTDPAYRVKKTGHIKLSAAKFGDQILDFVKARNTVDAALDASFPQYR